MSTELQNYEKEHIAAVRRMAPECMVLLKTDGHLPLRDLGDLALYGNGARYTREGGTGSGEVNSRYYPTIEEGLERAGFRITTKQWLDEYDEIVRKANEAYREGLKAKLKKGWLGGLGSHMMEPEYELPIDGAGDSCVYAVSRICGEGADREEVKGDFELTDTEVRDILAASRRYENFVLVLNVGGVVDLTPVMGVQNILLLSQTGCTIGDSLADVLLGKAFPSGRLADTWASYADYPDVGDFAQTDDTRYKEGIYAGYRWFESVGKKPLFPFGFGLNYTTFDMETVDIGCTDGRVSVLTKVTNVGHRAGKEVVQLYVSLPEGKLDQPYQTLAAFSKTARLFPEEEEDVSTAFNLADLASYDESRSARVLEAGDYILRVGRNSRDTKIVGVVTLTGDVIVEKVTPMTRKPDFEDFRPERRAAQPIPGGVKRLSVSPDEIARISHDFPSDVMPEALEAARKLSDEQLVKLCVGAYAGSAEKSLVGDSGEKVCGAAGESRPDPEDSGKCLIMSDGPAGLRLCARVGVLEDGSLLPLDGSLIDEFIDLMSGPAAEALRQKRAEREAYKGEVRTQYCTAIPIGSAIAQSFSPIVARMAGNLVGEEMERFHVNLWLAPAMNLHRNPLCGRNFEYFSEDPLIAGEMAAAITMGVQAHPGCGVTIKHFCCNDQETNRMNSNSMVSERALRDLYLRGFEIAVRKAQPAAVMTSYNLLNGEHTSQTRELLEGILRGEWGYTGLVMSDWVPHMENADEGKKWPGACAAGAVAAGNDLFMPGGPYDVENILKGLKGEGKYKVTRAELVTSAARVITAIRKLSVQK
ncbi:MAG: glycoside hydrolase family 3 N-terminal domain-containing protein [Lachnospiraceae bacterium]|jgi:beta-glucosidase